MSLKRPSDTTMRKLFVSPSAFFCLVDETLLTSSFSRRNDAEATKPPMTDKCRSILSCC